MIPIVIPNMILQHESTPTITRRLVKNYSFKKNCSGILRDSPTLNPATFLRLSKDNNNKKCCLCPCLPCLSPSWTKKIEIDLDERVFCKNTVYTSDGILQHAESKLDEFYKCTAYYLCLLSSKVGPILKSNAKQSKLQ